VTIFGVQLAHPWFLLCALLVLPATWWSVRGSGRVVFSSLRALPAGGATWRTRFAWLPDALIALAVVAFAIALAGPRKGERSSRVRGEGIAIVMAIDVSGSMRAEDLADADNPAQCEWPAGHDPTRLGAVKRVFEQFVTGAGDKQLKGRPDDAIGLVAFAHYAETRSPLTLDHGNLITAAEHVEFANGEDDGTAIGAGLELAVQRLIDFKAPSKVVVLLTDGESNVHDIDEDTAIDDAVKAHIKVYTIGAGTKGFAPICTDQLGDKGALVQMPVSIDEAMLHRIADKTGGKYFRATDSASLRAIYRDIDRLERSKIEEDRFTEFKLYYTWFVVAALALVALAFGLRGTVLRRLP
jgi:Ca-activated chloride channel family protein